MDFHNLQTPLELIDSLRMVFCRKRGFEFLKTLIALGGPLFRYTLYTIPLIRASHIPAVSSSSKWSAEHPAYTGTIRTREKCRYNWRAGISGAHLNIFDCGPDWALMGSHGPDMARGQDFDNPCFKANSYLLLTIKSFCVNVYENFFVFLHLATGNAVSALVKLARVKLDSLYWVIQNFGITPLEYCRDTL